MHGIDPPKEPNFARDMVWRYFEAERLKEMGLPLKILDGFETDCFLIIHAEASKQRKAKEGRNGSKNAGRT